MESCVICGKGINTTFWKGHLVDACSRCMTWLIGFKLWIRKKEYRA